MRRAVIRIEAGLNMLGKNGKVFSADHAAVVIAGDYVRINVLRQTTPAESGIIGQVSLVSCSENGETASIRSWNVAVNQTAIVSIQLVLLPHFRGSSDVLRV
jgi:predicted TIM-barrel enzyme